MKSNLLHTWMTLLLDATGWAERAVLFPALAFFFGSCHHGEPVTPDERSDTTSHNFVWQLARLGDVSSSVLYDVAIVSDTIVFAVGEIYERDSLGGLDPHAYNLAIWNGTEWAVERLYYKSGVATIRSVWAMGPKDVWLDPWFHWDGQTFIEQTIDPILFGSGIRHMWGTDGVMYAGGTAGFIGRFDGSRWQKLSSGTTLPIQDIWGIRNAMTGETEILAVAGEPYVSYDRRILKIFGSNVTTLSDSGIAYALMGTWFSPNEDYWVVGDGIYHKARSLNAPRWEGGPNRVTPYFANAIRGTAANDLFVAGALGELLHFNGSTWVSYRDQTGVTMGQYYSVAFKGNLVVAVGYESSRAIVAIGRRQ